MNEAMALDYLGLEDQPNDKETLVDALEMKVFELRNYFLQNPVVIPLVRSKMKRLQLLEDAANVFALSPKATPNSPQPELSSENLIDLLTSYEANLMRIRLYISQSLSPKHVIEGANRLIQLQDEFEPVFLDLTADQNTSSDEVKAAQSLDTAALLKALKSEDALASEALISKERKRIVTLRQR